MDPNATLAELRDMEGELRFERAHQNRRSVVHELERDIAGQKAILREWRRKGGFAPRDGWPQGV